MESKYEELTGYCSTSILANLFEVSDHWIGDLTRAGILQKHDTPTGGRYSIEEAIRAYCRYLRERADERGDTAKEAEKLAAEVRYKTAKAEYAELELAEFEGQMHHAEDVEAMTEQLTLTIRKLISSLPDRLANELAEINNASEAASVIRRACNAILDELTGFKYSPEMHDQLLTEFDLGSVNPD